MISKITKSLLTIVLVLTLAICSCFFYLSVTSQNRNSPGLVDGKLKPCPDKPNCVCSEEPTANIISAKCSPTFNFSDLSKIITKLGGKVKDKNQNYLSSTFQSRFFKFTDDLELRYDAQSHSLHFRSASRVGHSDLGANLKRIDQLKQKLYEMSMVLDQ